MTASVNYGQLRFELSNNIHDFTNQALSFEDCKTVAEQFILRAFQSDLAVGEDGINALASKFSTVTGNAEAGLELKEALPVLLMQSLYDMGIAPNAIKLNGTLSSEYQNFHGMHARQTNAETVRQEKIATAIAPLVVAAENMGQHLSRKEINAAIPAHLKKEGTPPFTSFQDLLSKKGNSNDTPTSQSL